MKEYTYYKLEKAVKKIVVRADSQVAARTLANSEEGCISVEVVDSDAGIYVMPDESMIRRQTREKDISEIQAELEERFPSFVLSEGKMLDNNAMIEQIIDDLGY